MAKVVGYALIGVGLYLDAELSGSGNYFVYAGQAILVGNSIEEARIAKRRAIAEYNASLTDRLEMVERVPDQPRTLAYGWVRAVEGVRRAWVSGTNSERLTMIVSFAGHEITGFDKFYFNDVELTLDGSGYVQTAPYAKGTVDSTFQSVTLDGTGSATVTLSYGAVSGTVTAVELVAGGSPIQLTCTVDFAHVYAILTITGGTAGGTAQLQYQASGATFTARIRTYLGTATQNVGADLAAEYPGNITSTDRFAGIALAVVDIDYDPDVYPQGRPNVTALFRGKKCYDPRLDSTAGGSGSQRLADPTTWTWTTNPALHAYDYARHPNGWAVPATEIRTADIAAAANVCDEIAPFVVS